MAIPSSKYTLDELEGILKKERPYLLELEETITQVENGIISVEVRRHKGKTTDYVVAVAKRTVL